MKLQEFQARKLFQEYGIAVPAGRAVDSAVDAPAAFKAYAHPTCIAKVQVLAGGRGKAGGVKRLSGPAEASAFCVQFLGKLFSTYQSPEPKPVRQILFTEDLAIDQEYYLGLVVDRSKRLPVLLVSRQGGVEIEEVAAKDPSAIVKVHFAPEQVPAPAALDRQLAAMFPDEKVRRQITRIASDLCRLFIEKDCSIAEINPLALLKDGRVAALDAKIVLDDNATFRHPESLAMKDPDEDDPRERAAKQFGLSYVSMNGNIGCLVNGAGLAMATMDMIKLSGGEPANFLDVGGGATADQVREAFKLIVQDPQVEAILVNIFGGIMKCDVIAEGVIKASREIALAVPLVVRLEGTHVEEGRAMLKRSGLKILSCDTLADAAQNAVREAAHHRESHVSPRR